jgi:saccharopine dehydrogenase (NAD+, L-lysine-forming)
MSIDIPMFLEGELRYVGYFREDGIALREEFDFPLIGRVPVYPYPHPEQVTLPRALSLRRVTNKGTVLPSAYYNLIRDLCGLGLDSRESLSVRGSEVIPYDFAIAYILRERERILRETGFGAQRGCTSIVVSGRKEGRRVAYRFHMASESQGLGEGTGIPLAMGAILLNRGKITASGVHPPEAVVLPTDFLAVLPEVFTLDKEKTEGRPFSGFILEKVDENGVVTRKDLSPFLG